MYAAILFDAEAVYGDPLWLDEVKQVLRKHQEDYPVFLRHFAISVMQFNTPIGFFGGLITENEDRKHDYIDIKKGGIFPIVHGIRCYALEHGIEQTNTHWRIKALMDKGVFKKEFGIELGETLNYLNTLRLESMLHQIADGKDIPNNKIRLSELSHMQQDVLKQSFGVVDGFKKRVIQHFNLQEML
jgi:CBS domain-containing protein